MTSSVQPSGIYPVTLHDWERVLTSALLRSDGGNADPVRSFEITPETLAAICGHGMEHASGAEAAFRTALVRDPNLNWCLKNGTLHAPGTEVPNCMAMLACSLLVDSLLDGDYEGTGAYRAKLGQWLGMDRSFMDLRGIATMWRELVDWLDGRVVAGAPFRRLILPEIPPSWTHIGYTRYLSFPTRRDIRFLRKQVETNSRCASDPAFLVRRLDSIVATGAVSFGLRIAFEDFRRALRSGSASTDHRFWRLVGRAAALSGLTEAPVAALLMEFDEDGMRRFRAKAAGDDRGQELADAGQAVAIPQMSASLNLGPAVRRGVLFFQSTGLASWTASGDPPMGVGPFHIAIADRHARLAAGTLARFERSGTWCVTSSAVARSTMTDILARLGIRDAGESVRSVGLADGVHVGKAWLGLPRFLPRLEGATSSVEIRPLSQASATISRMGDWLKSDGSVEGDFLIADTEAGWSRRASFVTTADVHADMDGAAYRIPEVRECRVERPRPITGPLRPGLIWDESSFAFCDLIEALYASARSGIAESDAVGLIGRVAGRRTWDLLRTLQESTFFDVRLRERWRGRVFTLGRPTLIRFGNGLVAVAGALPSKLEEEFRQTVSMHGGRPFRRLSPGSFSPPLIGATDVDPAILCEALGWASGAAASQPDGSMIDELIDTGVSGEAYELASAWDWNLGRFRVGAPGDGPVSLVRLVHPGGRDHDLYHVDGARRRAFLSRHAAIIEAHAQAARPLFRISEGLMARLPTEGSLPLEVARALRLRSLVNGGASQSGWSYSIEAEDMPWLGTVLRPLVEGLPTETSADEMLLARRGRGARRPMWIGGGIAA